jgi:hypothetical protein
MAEFIKGKQLCEQFFFEIAEPLLKKHFPTLLYSAGLLGYGSDVLGYDDIVSTDHMWGPRFYLFLNEEDFHLKPSIMKCFSESFPYEYQGFSVNFSTPNPNDGGVQTPENISEGYVNPLIFIHTFEEFLENYLGRSDVDGFTSLDWLSFSEHRLLALTAGNIFADNLNLQNTLDKLSYYPENVRRYLLFSNWELISQEQAFVKRCASVNDEIGSILACARISDRLMRLAFLYKKQYAPYSKWLGTAFTGLDIDDKIKQCIHHALKASSISGREKNLVTAQKLVADLHDISGITEPVRAEITNYFGRDICVISADRIAEKIQKTFDDDLFSSMPPLGTLSQIPNLTSISDKPEYQRRIKHLYADF